MEKLFIVIAALMSSQAQAGILSAKPIDTLKTSIRCVAKNDVSTMSLQQLTIDARTPETLRSITVGDYKFSPKQVGEDKIILVQSVQSDGAKLEKVLEFGSAASSAVTMPVTMNDGTIYYCNILVEKN